MSTGLCNRKSVNFKLLVEFVEKQKGLKSPKTGLRTNLTDKSGSPPRPAATPLYLAVVPGTFMPCIFAPECRINMLTYKFLLENQLECIFTGWGGRGDRNLPLHRPGTARTSPTSAAAAGCI